MAVTVPADTHNSRRTHHKWRHRGGLVLEVCALALVRLVPSLSGTFGRAGAEMTGGRSRNGFGAAGSGGGAVRRRYGVWRHEGFY